MMESGRQRKRRQLSGRVDLASGANQRSHGRRPRRELRCRRWSRRRRDEVRCPLAEAAVGAEVGCAIVGGIALMVVAALAGTVCVTVLGAGAAAVAPLLPAVEGSSVPG
jgi:hypothetical protein